MRILIVDDNTAMRKVLAALFAQVGHEVVASLPDGQGLEAALLESRPDLVCLDYHLPGRDGLALLAMIHARNPEIDVILMTASSDTTLAGRAANAGAAGFIRKPFGQQQIVDELKGIADARQLASKTSLDLPSPRASLKASAVIADDNASIRTVLKGVLESCGMKVLQSVASGSEAIQAVRTHRPDVLCLDIEMPVMNGLDALPQIREASPETAVVMVTGTPDKATVALAATLGAKGYILKPLRAAYVENFMRKLLGT